MAEQYLRHSTTILGDARSVYKPNRTGIDSLSLFGYQNEYDLGKGFPLLTTKKMAVRGIIHELIWFMRGDSNIKYLVDNNVHIWDDNAFQHYLKKQGSEKKFPMYSDEWIREKESFIISIKAENDFAAEHGDLGPVYGRQWRHWRTAEGKEIDQFDDAISLLKKSPQSRRNIVSAWNPVEVPNMALPPCHTLFHLNVADEKVDCQLYQRSCDMFLGVPFNIASYAMLTQVIAQQAGRESGRFIHTFGDSHFYCGADKRGAFYAEHFSEIKSKVNGVQHPSDFLEILRWIEEKAPPETKGKEGQDHVTGILEQLSREPRPLPKMKIAQKHYSELTLDDFVLEGYDAHPAIKRAMAV